MGLSSLVRLGGCKLRLGLVVLLRSQPDMATVIVKRHSDAHACTHAITHAHGYSYDFGCNYDNSILVISAVPLRLLVDMPMATAQVTMAAQAMDECSTVTCGYANGYSYGYGMVTVRLQ